jgi:hypothetical protein
VVLGVFKLFHGSRRALLAVCVAGIVASSIVMASLYNSDDPSRAYFGTDARIHTILVGAVLALVLLARPPRTATARRSVQIFGLVGAAGMLWTMHAMSDQSSSYYHGGSLLFAVAVAGLIAAVMQPSRTALRLGLSLTPLVWIGRISYGLYLWHWPVNVYLTAARTGWGATQLNVVRLAVTFGFAIASYFLVEMPIRRGVLHGDWARWAAPVAIAGIGLVLIVATIGATSAPSYVGGAGGVVKTSPTSTTRVSPISAQPASSGGAVTAEPGVDFRTGGAVAPLGIVNCPPPGPTSATGRTPVKKAVAPAASPRSDPGARIGDSLGCSIAVGLGPAGAPAIVAHQATIVEAASRLPDQVFDEAEPFRGTEHSCSQMVDGLERPLADFPGPRALDQHLGAVQFRRRESAAPHRNEAWKQSAPAPPRRVRAPTADGAQRVPHDAPARRSMINGGRIVSGFATGGSRR